MDTNYTVLTNDSKGRASVISYEGHTYIWDVQNNVYSWYELDTTASLRYTLECQYNTVYCAVLAFISKPKNATLAIIAALLAGILLGITL